MTVKFLPFFRQGRPLIVRQWTGVETTADGVLVSVEAGGSDFSDDPNIHGKFRYVMLSSRFTQRGHVDWAGLPEHSIVSSEDPAVLTALYESGVLRNDIDLAFRVAAGRKLSNGPMCPFSGIEVPIESASHDAIRRIHGWGKAVYVRVETGQTARRDLERQGLDWLSREQVDVVIYAP